MTLVLKNCRFIPFLTEGVLLDRGDVVIEDGIITKISPCGCDITADAECIDLEGKTLMPGLINMHVHLFDAKPFLEVKTSKAIDRVFDCYNYAMNLLDYGYTTVRDCGDDLEGPTVVLAKAIDSGIVNGPNIIPSVGTLCPHEPGVEILDFIVDYVNGPMEMRDKVRRHFQEGAQFIKLYGSGSMMAVGSEPGLRILEEDEIREAVKMAKNKNSYVAIHAHGKDAIDIAVRCGVRTIEHASLISEENLQYIDEHKEEVGIVPTASVFFDMVDSSTTDDFFAQRARKLSNDVITSLSNAYKHGVMIGWGTDVSLASFLSSPFVELQIRKDRLGYSNEEILKQLTIYSAKLMMMDDKIATVKEGKLADLIVVDGDPVEDLTVMYKKPVHVLKSGKVIH